MSKPKTSFYTFDRITVSYEIIPGEFPIYHGRNANPGRDAEIEILKAVDEKGRLITLTDDEMKDMAIEILENIGDE